MAENRFVFLMLFCGTIATSPGFSRCRESDAISLIAACARDLSVVRVAVDDRNGYDQDRGLATLTTPSPIVPTSEDAHDADPSVIGVGKCMIESALNARGNPYCDAFGCKHAAIRCNTLRKDGAVPPEGGVSSFVVDKRLMEIAGV